MTPASRGVGSRRREGRESQGARPRGPTALLPIGALARESGVAIDTIRYYEKIGLLPPPPRSAGGQRLYPPAVAARLGFIRRARALGFSLEDIRGLLRLADGDPAPCAEVAARAGHQREAIRARIAALQAMEAALARLLASCAAGETGPCPLIEALYGENDPIGADVAGREDEAGEESGPAGRRIGAGRRRG